MKYVFKTLVILTKGKLKVGVENIVHVRYWFLCTFCSVTQYETGLLPGGYYCQLGIKFMILCNIMGHFGEGFIIPCLFSE